MESGREGERLTQNFTKIFFRMLIFVNVLKIFIQVLNFYNIQFLIFSRPYLINIIKKFSNPDFIHWPEFRPLILSTF